MSTLRSGQNDSAEWGAHEHVSDAAKAHAQQLVHQVGSVDLAKHALDVMDEVIKNPADPLKSIDQTDRQMNFCHSLGFESRDELFGRSTATPSNDGKHWFESQLGDGSWVVWNEEDLQADRHFASHEEALTTVPHDDKLSGSSSLG